MFTLLTKMLNQFIFWKTKHGVEHQWGNLSLVKTAPKAGGLLGPVFGIFLLIISSLLIVKAKNTKCFFDI